MPWVWSIYIYIYIFNLIRLYLIIFLVLYSTCNFSKLFPKTVHVHMFWTFSFWMILTMYQYINIYTTDKTILHNIKQRPSGGGPALPRAAGRRRLVVMYILYVVGYILYVCIYFKSFGTTPVQHWMHHVTFWKTEVRFCVGGVRSLYNML